jgi:hypothetical protein
MEIPLLCTDGQEMQVIGHEAVRGYFNVSQLRSLQKVPPGKVDDLSIGKEWVSEIRARGYEV